MTERNTKLDRIATCIVHDMFKVKKGEVVVLTADPASNHDVVEAICRVVHAADALVVTMKTPKFKGRVALVDESISVELFVNALLQADIWIDANYFDYLYSNTFERVMAGNSNLRYFLLGDLSTDTMGQIYGAYDVSAMIDFCTKLREIIEVGRTVRVTNGQGTDMQFDIEPSHFVAVDSGEIAGPGLFTPPALVNIVPRFGSVNGQIVFDALYDAYPDKIMEEPLTLTIKDSSIVQVSGNRYAARFTEIMGTWDDGGRKVAHMNFGLLPTIRELVGHVVVDERVWGITNWGFGSVSPLDAPPNGQPSDYHFDAICTASSVAIDGVAITAEGEVVHPVLKGLADRLLRGENPIRRSTLAKVLS